MADKTMTFSFIIKDLHQPQASSKHMFQALLFFVFFIFFSFSNADELHAHKTAQEGFTYNTGPEPAVLLTAEERAWLKSHPDNRYIFSAED